MNKQPYKRKDWNEDIIGKINELCVNPDDGCPPVDELEEVDEKHIWTKKDITEAQDKLIEICPENSFDDLEEKQLWLRKKLLDPLDEAIERGWCNCVPEETIYDLGTYEQTTIAGNDCNHWMGGSAPGTVKICSCGCFFWVVNSPCYPNPADANLAIITGILNPAQIALNTARSKYFGISYEIFDLKDELKDLENELSVLEGQLTNLQDELIVAENELTEKESIRDVICDPGPSVACTNAENDVTYWESEVDRLKEEIKEKETEISDKETEIEEKESEIETKQVEQAGFRLTFDTKAQEIWAALIDIEPWWPPDINPTRLMPPLSEPWGDYFEDTKNRPKGKLQYTVYQFHSSTTHIKVGKFSPGGYPYLPYGKNWFDIIERTCNNELRSKYTDCSCYAWKGIIGGECFGQPDDYLTTETFFDHYNWYGWGPLETDCISSGGTSRSWQLSLTLYPEVDYTRE